MKKFLSVFTLFTLLISVFMIKVSAASGSLTGPSTARAGDTITVSFRISGGTFYGYSGSLSYDSSVLTLQGVYNSAGSNWAFTSSGNNIVAYDNTGNNHPVTSAFTAKFRVNSGVSPQTSISVRFSGTASGGGSETGISGSYSAVVAAPLSGDATLSSLKVSNATLSPNFSPNTTSYSCGTVGFDVSKLGVTATANADGAKVSISGSALSVGNNKVYIKVTAPNGASKTYVISVTREQDPNYKPSSNTKLTGITLSSGIISPAYNADVKEYVTYVPYEVTTITISAAAADPLAKGVTGVEDAALKVGLNEFELKCTAEDDSVGTYKIYVVRMNEFGGVDSITLPKELSKTVESETTSKAEVNSQKKENKQGVSPILLGVLGFGCLILGFAVGMVVSNKKNDRNTPNSGHGDREIKSADLDASFDYEKYVDHDK